MTRTRITVGIIVTLLVLALFATAKPGADQPATSPDPLNQVLIATHGTTTTVPLPPSDIGEPLAITVEADGTTCEEDEACFDCATMGNLLCGPAPAPAPAPVVAASPGYTG